MFPAGDVAMNVIKQSQHNPGGGNTIAIPWQQYRRNVSSQTRVVFGYVIVLCSRRTEEMWLCDMTSSCPDQVIVVNRHKYFFCDSTLLIIESYSLVVLGQFPL